MPKYVKCPVCEGTVPYLERHSLIVERDGGRNRFYHEECHKKFLKHKEFKKEENLKLAQLEEVVKQVHGIKKVPSPFFSALQDIRNGTERYRSMRQFKYKKGATFPEIAKAYELAKQDIHRIKRTKTFKDDEAELRYCLHKVLSRINQAVAQLKREERQQTIQLMGDVYGDMGEDRPIQLLEDVYDDISEDKSLPSQEIVE